MEAKVQRVPGSPECLSAMGNLKMLAKSRKNGGNARYSGVEIHRQGDRLKRFLKNFLPEGNGPFKSQLAEKKLFRLLPSLQTGFPDCLKG